MKARLTAPAAADLAEIARYVAVDSLDRAVKLIDELRDACDLLARQPGLGVRRPSLGENIRTHSAMNYVIVYTEDERGTSILRVLHGARHIEALVTRRFSPLLSAGNPLAA